MVFIAYSLITIGVSVMIYGAWVTHKAEKNNTGIDSKVSLSVIGALVLLTCAKAILY